VLEKVIPVRICNHVYWNIQNTGIFYVLTETSIAYSLLGCDVMYFIFIRT
jgi:hypothetical protein